MIKLIKQLKLLLLKYSAFGLFFVLILARNSQADTFSITAVDPVTGFVGSAGASCVAGCIILSDVHPGVGVIHTQAYYIVQNQIYARSLMNLGLSPQQIVDSMVLHDAQGNPTIRQYGIVDLVGGGRTAGYTGVNCNDYKNHILGPTYTIQGNILLGQQILDSMQARFLRTNGSLADKLMAALQGAKVIGADTRCSGRGTSSISSFIRVAKPTDPTGGPYFLDLNVNNTAPNHDPIDSLQILYNNWIILNGVTTITTKVPAEFALYQNYPNPFNPMTIINFDIAQANTQSDKGEFVRLIIYNNLGKEVSRLVEQNLSPGKYQVNWLANNFPSGVYYYKLETQNFFQSKKLVLMK
jgi:uncharacterized Ntn-hydrolase superfamily protein